MKNLRLLAIHGSLVALLLLFVPGMARPSSLGLSGSGDWGCGFYPGDTGYGATTDLSFMGQDAQGNPVTGNLSWGDPHAAPVCTPGLQLFQGVTPAGGLNSGLVSGTYTYLGQTYSSVYAGETTSACTQPGCYLAVTASANGQLAITLGFESAGTLEYLNLAGNVEITSSHFGQQASDGGLYYYSKGTFTVGNVPEPTQAGLILSGAMLILVVAVRQKRRGPLT